MPEPRLSARMQPALLDRLLVDEKFVAHLTLTAPRERLASAGIDAASVVRRLGAEGFSRIDEGVPAQAETIRLTFVGPIEQGAAGAIRAMSVIAPRTEEPVAFGLVFDVDVKSIPDPSGRDSDTAIDIERLRRIVVERDLPWLLNTTCLGVRQNLDRYPEVRSSVVNFGMPALMGRAISGIDVDALAASMIATIERFEPRLRNVRVAHEPQKDPTAPLRFRIEADLWGQPAPLPVLLYTDLAVDTGEVRVSDNTRK
jgi:type VI secretion system protein ImpF